MNNRIEDTMKYVFANNKAKHPYHNTAHCVQVYNNVVEICQTLPELSKKEVELLSIAALFHDFNHSGGKLTDDKNVEIALKEFKKYAVSKDFLEVDISFVQRVIEATQYPYVDIKQDIFTDIIRDADMLGSLSAGWMQVMFNLADEFKKSVEEFVPMQIKFHENMKLNTKFGKEIQKKHQKNILKTLNCF